MCTHARKNVCISECDIRWSINGRFGVYSSTVRWQFFFLPQTEKRRSIKSLLFRLGQIVLLYYAHWNYSTNAAVNEGVFLIEREYMNVDVDRSALSLLIDVNHLWSRKGKGPEAWYRFFEWEFLNINESICISSLSLSLLIQNFGEDFRKYPFYRGLTCVLWRWLKGISPCMTNGWNKWRTEKGCPHGEERMTLEIYPPTHV